jgi:hypothetical protein
MKKKPTKLTKEQLLEEVYHIDPMLKEKGNEEARDAVLLLVGALVDGPDNANKTAKIPVRRYKKFMKNLRENGVFVDNKIHAEWDDPEAGGCALILDANVAMGYMNRING